MSRGSAAGAAPLEQTAEAPTASHTPGPWHYTASTQHHGPYVSADFGGDVCDCYTMSNPALASVRNGGSSFPVPFQGDHADANARLISASPDLLAVAREVIAVLYERAGPDNEHLTERETELWFSAREALTKAGG